MSRLESFGKDAPGRAGQGLDAPGRAGSPTSPGRPLYQRPDAFKYRQLQGGGKTGGFKRRGSCFVPCVPESPESPVVMGH